METLLNFVAQVLRRVFKLVLVVWVSLFALALLSLAVTAALLTVLWSLLRGRKPALFTTFTRFRQASQQFSAGGWNRQGGFARPTAEDVVDVQANEVRSEVLPLPGVSDKS
ncbi:hypothetical protein [Rhodoferax saidenbachensis]|uniref:Membrane protein YgcG n=1 Tax=Rhodoferax saidenbachensis TaxID=1484693 RepID=A0ABU1ZUE5_9BURK|nr:hypothetical protein [Rhodoferax saidenbachensis]MDR7308591.1 putative membrane protein YgcG [Rhodoferax saidenbachensis]